MPRYFIYFITILSLNFPGRANPFQKFINDKDIFGTRVFVENKGQFDKIINTDEQVLYGYENGNERIYFTAKGLVYKMIKTFPLTEEQREEQEKGKRVKQKPGKLYFVHMNWANANPNIKIEQSEKQSGYFTYGEPGLNSSTFKKITYKNIYDHIDIEYIIPDDKEYGIKYTIILHPGADSKNIKIVYSGDLKKIVRKGKDVLVKTRFENFLEHAPKSFYKNKQSILSSFTLNKDTLGFNFQQPYDSTQTVIIDPWVTPLTTLTNANNGYDVDYDYAGNLYVYGGGSPNTAVSCKIAKYSPTGVLLWTFPTVLAGIGWNNVGLSGIPGNCVVNKFTQKVYTGETFGCKIIRLDINGNYDNLITASSVFWSEMWEMDFNPCTGKIYAYGGGTSFNRHAAILDEVNATAIPVNLSGFPQTNQDIVCSTIDDNGDVFLAYVVPAPNFLTTPNNLLKVNTTFNGNSWTQLSTYATLLEYSNKPFFTGLAQSITAPSSNGFNCLAVNGNYLYYYDGFNVAAYNKTTGIKIGSTTIAGYAAIYQGGIAVDNCDNVYVGGNGVINVFHFSGTNFVALPTVPLGVTGPQQRVYDLKLDRTAGILYVSGSNFVKTLNTSQICSTVDQVALTFTCGPNNNAVAVTSVTPALPGALISYSWSNTTGIIAQTANSAITTNTLTNLVNGNYTVTIQINAPCGPSYTKTVNIDCPLCSVATTGSVGCIPSGYGFLLSAINPTNFVSGPSYTWTGPGGFISNLVSPSFTNGSFGVYTLTASDGFCTCTASVTLNAIPPLILVITTNSVSGCIGNSVNLTGNTSGGSSPYTYSWTNGPSNSLYSVTENAAGIHVYTLTATDAGKCKTSNTVSLIFNSIPVVTVNSQTICEGSSAALQANGADTYLWLPGNSTNNPYTAAVTANSSFTVFGTSKGCISSATTNVGVTKAPVVLLNPLPAEGCEPLCVNLSNTSPTSVVSYTWLVNSVPIGSTSSISNYCFKSSGNYLISVIAKDMNGCNNLKTGSLIRVYEKPRANFIFTGEFALPYAEVFYADGSSANVTRWSWYFGDGDSSFTKNPKHVFNSPSLYATFLVVETPYGCADTISKLIKIEDIPLLYIPNTFTPNGDGHNDLFFAKGTGIRDFKMLIFDRWGQKIFEANDMTTSWDGTYKGIVVKEDSYVWQIIYTPVRHRTETITGHVNVLR